jgi:phage-related protein
MAYEDWAPWDVPPAREIDIAEKRMKDFLARNEVTE